MQTADLQSRVQPLTLVAPYKRLRCWQACAQDGRRLSSLYQGSQTCDGVYGARSDYQTSGTLPDQVDGQQAAHHEGGQEPELYWDNGK